MVSDETVKWNASAEWAKKHGVNIQRYNWQRTAAVPEYARHQGLPEHVREWSLPATLLDGQLVMAGKLPVPGRYRPLGRYFPHAGLE
ncbi:hypothetical protein [Klebsiella quasipneumoniae]|uniref:hypothetical protein n=1 Tax=Klebsiella quasipneumoniae TaxID=1463165 RepID=UPI003890762B